MTTILHANFDLFTPCDLRAHIFRVDLEFSKKIIDDVNYPMTRFLWEIFVIFYRI